MSSLPPHLPSDHPIFTQFNSLPIMTPPSYSAPYYVSRSSKQTGVDLFKKLILMSAQNPGVIPIIQKMAFDRQGYSLYKTTSGGWTPLMIACKNARTASTDAVVNILIQAGSITINAKNKNGRTALS